MSRDVLTGAGSQPEVKFTIGVDDRNRPAVACGECGWVFVGPPGLGVSEATGHARTVHGSVHASFSPDP